MKKISLFTLAVLVLIFVFDLCADECTGISFGFIYPFDYYNVLDSYDVSGLPEGEIGELHIRFQPDPEDEESDWIESAAVGTYDLGSDINSNLQTCRQCVILDVFDEDYDDESMTSYFQESGTLEVTLLDEEAQMTNGTVSAKLVQVEIDEDTWEASVVENGSCIEIESTAWVNVCVPDCEGKICGSDGCGGTCGEGCGDKKCNAAQDACVDWDCTQITLPEVPTFEAGAYNFKHTPAVFDEDFTSLEIYSINEIGAETYDLAEEQTLYCDICLYLYEDTVFDEEGYFDYSKRLYFQESGTLSIKSFDSETRSISAEFDKVRLHEVEFNALLGDIEPVPGGKCYEIAHAPFVYGMDGGDTEPTDTGTEPSDTGDIDDTGTPADSGDTDTEPADKGDSEPGDAGDTENTGDTGSETTDSGDEKKDSGGCSLNLI